MIQRGGFIDTVQFLISTGVSTASVDNAGKTAADYSSDSRITALLTKGNKFIDKDYPPSPVRANVEMAKRYDQEEEARRTKELFKLAADGDDADCKRLIVGGADPFAVDENGRTLLHIAARAGENYLYRFIIFLSI